MEIPTSNYSRKNDNSCIDKAYDKVDDEDLLDFIPAS